MIYVEKDVNLLGMCRRNTASRPQVQVYIELQDARLTCIRIHIERHISISSSGHGRIEDGFFINGTSISLEH